MKLYTEDQVRMLDINCIEGTLDEVIACLTPIELPTDEEVRAYANSFPYTKHLDDGQYNDGVIIGVELGAKWVIDKIKGGEE